MGLVEDLGEGAICVDAAVFIYFLEEHPSFLPLIRPVFKAANEGLIEIVTSALTLTEVLVVPYRAGNLSLAKRYEEMLTSSQGIRLIDLNGECLRGAAQLRSVSKLKRQMPFRSRPR